MDYSTYIDDKGLRSPYYRVSAKAIIRDADGRILAACDNTGTWELPGGGWEHDETFEECLSREIEEELGVKVARIGDLQIAYSGPSETHPHTMMRIAADVELASHDFKLQLEEVTETRFVDKQEFLKLDWCSEDREVVQHVEKLWPTVEKSAKNR